MREAALTIAADTDVALQAIASVERRLFEQFPEFGRHVIHDELLRALNERPVFSARPPLGAGNDVIRLEVVLDASLVFEVVAAALSALNRNGIGHG